MAKRRKRGRRTVKNGIYQCSLGHAEDQSSTSVSFEGVCVRSSLSLVCIVEVSEVTRSVESIDLLRG